MKDDVKQWIETCSRCQLSKPPIGRKAPLTQDFVGEPLERVAADIISFPTPSSGKDKVLIICDYFTKWAEAYPIETQSAQETVDSCLVDFFANLECPDSSTQTKVGISGLMLPRKP